MAPHPLADPDVALNLALAVIASSSAPLLLLDGDLGVIAASKSFCRAFALPADGVAGKTLAGLGDGEWNVPQLVSLLKLTASGQADVEGYEFNLLRFQLPDRRLVVNAKKLSYGDDENVRLMVAVLDVTEARIAEKAQG